MMLGSDVNSSFVPLHVMMTARDLLFQYETLQHRACLMCVLVVLQTCSLLLPCYQNVAMIQMHLCISIGFF